MEIRKVKIFQKSSSPGNNASRERSIMNSRGSENIDIEHLRSDNLSKNLSAF